jgi:hypothetical protein
MSERERKPDPHFFLDIGDKNLECRPENTLGFLYGDPKYDHIFFITENHGETMNGFFIFRATLGEQFDPIVLYMINNGYSVENMEELTEGDLKAYERSFGCEIPTQEVSQRGENKIAFLRYILEKELLIADDFNGKNELYI